MNDSALPDLRPVAPGARIAIGDADADVRGIDTAPLKQELKSLRKRIAEVQEALHADGRSALLVIFQGRDASGKDGTIKAVFKGVNPQGIRVTAFRQPTPDELAHDFLWRVHAAVPPRGVIGLFNRSHYEDVLVVRVNELVPRRFWEDRYDRINDFEAHLAASGVVILKFFLHISREEQRVRLIERLEDPTKNWKFNAGDLAERARWDAYTDAYEAAISRCSTAEAPWYVVPADRNSVRDVVVGRTVLQALERIGPVFPPATPEALELRATIV